MLTLFLLTMHILVCFVLILVVLLQTGKRADLAGAFGGGGSQTAFGARGAATFLSKATTWSAVIFMVTSVVLGVRFGTETSESVVKEPTSRSAPAPPPGALPQPVPVSPPPGAPPPSTPPSSGAPGPAGSQAPPAGKAAPTRPPQPSGPEQKPPPGN